MRVVIRLICKIFVLIPFVFISMLLVANTILKLKIYWPILLLISLVASIVAHLVILVVDYLLNKLFS